MSVVSYPFTFTGGVAVTPGFGDRWKILFSGNWAFGDTWTLLTTTLGAGDFTLGVGAFGTNVPTACYTMKDRVYLAVGSQFNFSENGDPTLWEEQNAGAGFIDINSQFGGADKVYGFGTLQGRLVVFGRRTIELWNVAADPSQFSQAQVLDNTGTKAPASAQNMGDFDVLYLDDTGVRSTQSKEVTLNAFLEDVGIPIDDIVQPKMRSYDWSGAVGIVDPLSKRYWIFVKDTIYVLSRFRGSKILAWSTFLPTDDKGTAFTPAKFVVFNGLVYCRTTDGRLVVYGGQDGNTYDSSIMTVETPWMTDKTPENQKAFNGGLTAAIEGQWQLWAGCDPRMWPPQAPIVQAGDTYNPNMSYDSTYDDLIYNFEGVGSHFKLKAVTTAYSGFATFSAFAVKYFMT